MYSVWAQKTIASIISIALGVGVVVSARQRMGTPSALAQSASALSDVASFHAHQAQLVASDGAANNNFGGSVRSKSGNASMTRAQATGTIVNDNPPTFQLSSIIYTVNEGDGFVTVTVVRTGDVSEAVNVDYATSDSAGAQNCSVVNGQASSRCDYLSAVGTLKFATGETSKTVSIQIVDDSYAEGPEIFNIGLSNPTSPAVLGSPTTAIVTINDNDTSNGVNPVDAATFFIRQQYIDFLNRQPDDSGLNFWSGTIASCGSDQQCVGVKRVNASGAFFLSIEFQNTGYLVYRIYKSAYGNISGVPVPIRLNEFLPDTQEIGQGVIVNQGNWQQQLENNKQAFTLEFVQRSRFATAFPTTLTPAQFVDAMFANGGVTASTADRNTAIAEFAGAGTTTDVNARSRALRDVADNSTLQRQEFNKAFVLMQYFGYLRRNPNDAPDADFSGYSFWLSKLNSFGNYIDAEMVKAFISSTEYRSRFGPLSTISTPTPTPSPTPSPTPTPGSGLTPEQRHAALDSVRAEFDSLSNSGLSRNDVNQQLLNFVRSRPEFADAGISPDSCVWATYTDGIELVVANNLDADVQPASPSNPALEASVRTNAKPEPENVPDSVKARLLWDLGPLFDDTNPTPDLRSWLTDQNYTQPLNEGNGDVTSLKQVGGDGVLFLAGHGGTVDNADFAVSSSEFVSFDLTKENPEGTGEYDDDLKNHRLVYMIASWSRDKDTGKKLNQSLYAITSNFVRQYWGNFAANSFVYIAGCDGAIPGAADFQKAMQEKGASVYAGWTGPTLKSQMADTARFAFDRLLGANQVYPESDGFKQRPFDYPSVQQDFQYHDVGHNPTDGTDLVFKELSTPTVTTGFQTLAPSIYRVLVNEYPAPPSTAFPSGLPSSELQIIGEFGVDPGENNRSVTVGGQSCTDIKWVNDLEIRCHLAVSGPGSAGAVVVTVRGHHSNTATLSYWEGDFIHKVAVGVSIDSGFLTQTAIYHVRFRADVRKARAHIHEPPTFDYFGLSLDFNATEDSQYSYKCEGTLTADEGNYIEIWSTAGPGVFLRGTDTKPSFTMLGVFKNESSIEAVLSVNADYLSKKINNITAIQPLYAPLLPPDGITTFILKLDAKFNISGDTKTYAKDTGDGIHGTWNNTLQWDSIQANSLPDPNTAR